MSRPRSDGAWSVSRDPVRGQTRLRADDLGRPAEVELADGTRLAFERDRRGGLCSLRAGSLRIAIDPPAPGRDALRVVDAGGATEMCWRRGRAEVRRDGSAVALEFDDAAALRRVEVPGLRAPLVYARGPDGRIAIGLADRPPLLRVQAEAGRLEVESELGGWRESRRPGRVALRAWAAEDSDRLEVEIEHDLQGRTRARRWSDGALETFERDERGRLSAWTRAGERSERRAYQYDGDHLAAEERDGQRWVRQLDEAGRVLALSGPGGARVEYRYDACGRRVAREERGRRTSYVYDPLGQLTAVEHPSGARIRHQFDGLGRRVARAGIREHRDPSGRLWSTTDAAGSLRHLYVWLDDRLIARLDGPSAELAELYAPDPLGTTLIALVRQPGAGVAAGGRPGRRTGPAVARARLERVAPPPFGAIDHGARPGLYGHLGDPATGLIHFGAREYDPQLGLFLTPDPWDGGPTDPRRWAGLPDGWIRRQAEVPLEGAHPYALCRFDPVGRVDRDGHMASMPSTAISVINTIASLILVPTWAWPLTAISLFFFLPIDLMYGEILFRLFLLIKRDRPFDTPYTIFNSIGATGSSRQGIAALGLNGLLPGIVTGHFDLHSERAVTIGNVIWIDRHELNRMARPSILELPSLAGWNVDPTKHSAIHVLGTGDKGKRFHASYWTRGYGNRIKVTPATPPAPGTPGTPEVIAFDDGQFEVVKKDGGREVKTLAPAYLGKPFPLSFPVGKPETLEAQEYLYDPAAAAPAAAKVGEVELVDTAWFALQMDAKSGLAANDFVEIVGKNLDPIHRQVVMVASDPDYDMVIVAADLPNPYKGVSLKVTRLIEDTASVETGDWAQDGADTRLKATVAAPIDPFRSLVAAARVRIAAPAGAPPAPPPGAPAPPPGAPAPAGATVYATVKQATVTVKLSAALDSAASAGDTVRHALESGGVGKAKLPDPANPGQLKWAGDKAGIGKGDFVSITAGADQTFARVTDSTDEDLTVELLAPKLGAAAAVDVDLRVLKDRTSDDEKASVVTGGTDDLELKFGPTALQPGNVVHVQSGDSHQYRKLASWSEVRLELSDPVPATDPALGPGLYKLRAAVEDPSLKTITGARVSQLKRFLKSTGGTKPADFGAYPGFLQRFWGKDPHLAHAAPFGCEFFAHLTGPSPFDPAFRASWTHATVGPDQYVILDHDLPITVDSKPTGVFYNLHRDPDDIDPDASATFELDPAGTAVHPVRLQIVEFKAGTTKRGLGLAEAHACVPEHPLVADTEAEALRQHELHHALQATHWGPFMGALPIGGIQSLIVDFDGAKSSNNPPHWLKDDKAPPETRDKFREFQGAQYVSIGALMEVVWAYLLTFGQAKKMHFENWNKLLNPFTANLIAAIGKHEHEDLDPNQPLSRSPGLAILQLLATASDLRSWVPFLGWVPLLLPDGPRSFLEQGASRASGDLYSTILSADDEFNRESDTRGFLPDIVPDYHSANIEKPLGEVVRLMVFTASRNDRVFTQGLANRPGTPVSYAGLYQDNEMVSLAPQAAALVHPDLYEPLAAAPAALSVDGPASSPAPVGFLQAAAGNRFRPRLRAFTPLPAQVLRSAGFYFVPAGPAKYDLIAHYSLGARLANGNPNPRADAGQDAKTQEVTLTIAEGDVTFGGDKVAYATPPAAGAAPGPLATPLKRFVTELVELRLGKQLVGPDPDDKHPGATRWELNLCTTAAVSPPPPLAANTVTPTAQTHGWDLQIGKTAGDVRVRLFRVYRKNDSTDDDKNDHAFDLLYPADRYPSLKNVRSYLEKDVWVVVRDFEFTVEDLPELTPGGKTASVDSETAQKLDLALALAGEAKPKVTVNWDRAKPRPVPDGDIPVPGVEKSSDTSSYPRGQVWQVKPLGGVLEEDALYRVTVTFGKGPSNSVDRTLDLTVTPFIRLKGAGATPFEAALNRPCTLTIEGGASPYRVSDDGLPAGTRAVVNGAQLVVTVARAPPAEKKVVLTVTDANGKKGRRTITVKAG